MSYTHRGAYLNSLGEVIHSGHSSASVYLWTLPMFHCNGWCTTWGVTAVGGTHVCLQAVRPDVIWRLMDEQSVTHLNGAPAVMTSIARAPEAHRFEHVVTATTGGAAPSPTFVAEMEALGARVIHVYGLTEVYGPYSQCDWQPDWPELEPGERARKLARQGVGMVTAERVRVVDPAMRDVPADGMTMGEADDRWGERPKAFVVLAPGQGVGERELIEHVRSRIAHYKAPDTIQFLAELPRNSTGKIQKFELRQQKLTEAALIG